jgi:CheY-like chemotaxis protein
MPAALKLLVVEDDITHLEQMAELLKQLKAEVRAISDCAEAALMIHREKFDGIFVDLDLPIVSGFHLGRLARESVGNHATPIAIVTGREQEDAMHMSFSLGANYFLRKPADMQTLDALLKEIRKPIFRNRLRIVRVPLNRDVSCKVGAETLRGLIWDISQGGIELEVAGLKLGDTVRMSFVLPRPVIVIMAEGSVMWVHEGRQGLYFTEMSIEHQHAVRTYISSG